MVLIFDIHPKILEFVEYMSRAYITFNKVEFYEKLIITTLSKILYDRCFKNNKLNKPSILHMIKYKKHKADLVNYINSDPLYKMEYHLILHKFIKYIEDTMIKYGIVNLYYNDFSDALFIPKNKVIDIHLTNSSVICKFHTTYLVKVNNE